MHKKVLVTDDVHASLLSGLAAAGFECLYLPNISDAEVREIISDYDGLIINSKINVDRAMLTLAAKLRFVGRLGSGMEIVDQTAAADRKSVV